MRRRQGEAVHTRRFAGIRRLLVVTGALVVAVALLSGCTRSIHGRAVSIYDDPFKVAGLPTTSGPNGPRAGTADSPLTAQDSDNGQIDHLVLNALDDIQTYWQAEFPLEFGGTFAPVTKFISWSAKTPRSQAGQFCGESSYRLVNAAYCRLDGSVGWDRGVLLPAVADEFGKMSVVMVLAHEYGHAIQEMAKIVGRRTPTIVKEQQADCFAGAFIRNVAEGKAKHFTINTSDGLNQVLAATVAFRDENPDDPQSVHGSAFQRVTAVQIGFTDGPKGCQGIDQNEIDRRSVNLPQGNGDGGQANSEVNQSNLRQLATDMAAILPIPDEPKYSYDTAKLNCRNAADTAPVTYCPATNLIGTDVSALHDRGVSNADDEGLPANVTGSYSAYIVFISRYTLAVQHAVGQALTGAKTGLRAACLSGVITAKLADPNHKSQSGITLTSGDIDEAVSGLLSDGLAASDTNGNTVPSGFSRVDAFRAGVLGDKTTCASRYS